jgi:hypothetical protein
VRRLAAALALLPVLLLPAPALAAGTGGVDISPYPGSINGEQITAFHVQLARSGAATVRYSVRNTTSKPAIARIYATTAYRGTNGAWTIGKPDAAPFIQLSDHVVKLRPHESDLRSFSVTTAPAATYGAVVVQVRNGSVVQRVATIVYFARPSHSRLSWTVVVVALVLLAGVAGGVLIARRRAAVLTS